MYVNDLVLYIYLETDGNNVGYVEDLDLGSIGVVTIPNAAFVDYASLKRLNLENASIRTIDDSWFNSNNDIVEWNLSHNEVATLRRTQFRHLKQLRLLNLMDNNIETIEPNSFQDLNQLTHLNLRFNRIQTLIPFGRLNRLNVLDLGENSITEVNNAKFHIFISSSFFFFLFSVRIQFINRTNFIPTDTKQWIFS